LVKSALLDKPPKAGNNRAMAPDFKIHDFQISILRELLFKPGARFRDLKKVDVTNDHFTFHVNHLIAQGLVEKKNGKYFLTTDGKEFANRMDTDALKLERQAKLCIAIHALRENNGQREYLVHRRLKEPFFGWYGSHSGKIRWAETPLECAKREFKEETGLTADFTLKGIVHYHHIHKDGRFLEDKYFWVFWATNIQGEMKVKVPEGENLWLTEKAFRRLKNVFSTFDEMMEEYHSPTLVYVDRVRVVDSY
jgi:ADP-ribose pyrophosphatase YjhB (NUDIX family)